MVIMNKLDDLTINQVVLFFGQWFLAIDLAQIRSKKWSIVEPYFPRFSEWDFPGINTQNHEKPLHYLSYLLA